MRNIRFYLIPLLFFSLLACQNTNQETKQGNENEAPMEVKQSVEYNQKERKNSGQISKRLVNIAEGVDDVKNATAVVLGKYAVVGIDVDDDLDQSRVGSVKYSVAEALHHDPYGANATITADPDLVERLRHMGQQINDGKPIIGIMEELAAITGRLMPEGPGQSNKKQQSDPTRSNDKTLPKNQQKDLQNQQQKQGKSTPSEPNRIKKQQKNNE